MRACHKKRISTRVEIGVATDVMRVVACLVAGRGDADMLQRNVPALLMANVDVAMYTYDGSARWYDSRHAWRRKLIHGYDVAPSVNKWYTCISNLPLSTGAYSHAWFLDADVDVVSSSEVSLLMRRGGDAAIFQPSVYGSDWAFVAPSRRCSVRVTDFVEVQAPVIHLEVLKGLMHLIPNNSTLDWGIDLIWCKYANRVLGVSRPCRIVNTDMQHVRRASVRRYDVSRAKSLMNCLIESFPHYQSSQRTLACARGAESVSERMFRGVRRAFYRLGIRPTELT